MFQNLLNSLLVVYIIPGLFPSNGWQKNLHRIKKLLLQRSIEGATGETGTLPYSQSSLGGVAD